MEVFPFGITASTLSVVGIVETGESQRMGSSFLTLREADRMGMYCTLLYRCAVQYFTAQYSAVDSAFGDGGGGWAGSISYCVCNSDGCVAKLGSIKCEKLGTNKAAIIGGDEI